MLTLLAVILIRPVHADQPIAVKDATAGKDKWTIEDVVYSESAHGFQIAPNGRWAVWVKTVGDKDKGESVSNLMRTDLQDGGDVELTRGSIIQRPSSKRKRSLVMVGVGLFAAPCLGIAKK